MIKPLYSGHGYSGHLVIADIYFGPIEQFDLLIVDITIFDFCISSKCVKHTGNGSLHYECIHITIRYVIADNDTLVKKLCLHIEYGAHKHKMEIDRFHRDLLRCFTQ